MNREDYKYLIGKKINKYKEDGTNIYFYTDEEIIEISKFEPYCCCNVGEYIDEIVINGECNGIITNIQKNINTESLNDEDEYDETVYKGNVTFYFENGKLNMNVHGEDNGYYGVSFTMPVYITKIDKEDNNE